MELSANIDEVSIYVYRLNNIILYRYIIFRFLMKLFKSINCSNQSINSHHCIYVYNNIKRIKNNID